MNGTGFLRQNFPERSNVTATPRASVGSALEELGHPEGEVEALPTVQPGVAQRRVPAVIECHRHVRPRTERKRPRLADGKVKHVHESPSPLEIPAASLILDALSV